MYVAILGILAVCLVSSSYPPIEFTICWFSFWIIQAAITAKLHIDKRQKTRQKDLLGALSEYINCDNVESIVENIVGVELKKNKKK